MPNFTMRDFSRWPDLSLKKVTVPCGQSGDVTIKKIKISEEEANEINFRQIMQAVQGRYLGNRNVAPGIYTGLFMGGVNQHPMMSDTPAEMLDHVPFVRAASGDVLITGLGIGLVVENLLVKANVRSITVVEKSEHVMALVAPHYTARRSRIPVTIIHSDAYTFEPAHKFDFCWHDIWPTISDENLSEMKKLRAKYKSFCANIQFWAERQCIWMRSMS